MSTATTEKPTRTRRTRKTGDPAADRAQRDAATAAANAKITPPAADAKPATEPEKPAKPEPMSPAARKRAIGDALIRAAADLAATWEHPEIGREDAAAQIAQWLSYLPASSTWDVRLGARSDAGRRKSA